MSTTTTIQPPSVGGLSLGVGTWDHQSIAYSLPLKSAAAITDYPSPGFAVALHIRYYFSDALDLIKARRWLNANSGSNYNGIINHFKEYRFDLSRGPQSNFQLAEIQALDTGLTEGWEVYTYTDRSNGKKDAYIDIIYRKNIPQDELDNVDAFLDSRFSTHIKSTPGIDQLKTLTEAGQQFLNKHIKDNVARAILKLNTAS